MSIKTTVELSRSSAEKQLIQEAKEYLDNTFNLVDTEKIDILNDIEIELKLLSNTELENILEEARKSNGHILDNYSIVSDKRWKEIMEAETND